MTYGQTYSGARREYDPTLTVEISNSALFPVDRVVQVFSPHARFSTNDYYKYPARGAQGNALKTILGIPYALHYHYFGNYNLGLRPPVTITSGEDRVAVWLDVDDELQRFQLKPPEILKRGAMTSGTTVSAYIDYFVQDEPTRQIEEISEFLEALAIFNPHATFHFDITLVSVDKDNPLVTQEKTWAKTFEGSPAWDGRFDRRERTPIHWYTKSHFFDLAKALVRAEKRSQEMPIELSRFAMQFGFEAFPAYGRLQGQVPLAAVIQQIDELDGLYNLLVRESHPRAIRLGEIGEPHIARGRAIPQSDNGIPLFFYACHREEKPKTETPFVLEVALCANGTDKRQILTGINHTRTYLPLFYNKPLYPPDAVEPVRGLEKLLDFYSSLPTGVTLTVHLIAPNVGYESYGKYAIVDQPYRTALITLVHEVVTKYLEAIRPPEPVDYLTDPATRLLPDVIASLAKWSFSLEQLLSVLRTKLAELANDEVTADLKTNSARARLQAVVQAHERRTGQPIAGLIRRQNGGLLVPVHPANTIYADLANKGLIDLVREHAFRAIIITNSPQIEDILIAPDFTQEKASNYLLRYDTAVLRADGDLRGALRLLIEKYQRIQDNPTQDDDALLPKLWIIRDATLDAIRSTRVTLNEVLATYKVTSASVIDFGLSPADAEAEGIDVTSEADPPTRQSLRDLGLSDDEISFYAASKSALIEHLPPPRLRAWFESKLADQGVRVKHLPSPEFLARDVKDGLEERLKAVVSELAFQHYNAVEVLARLYSEWESRNDDWRGQFHRDLEAYLTANPTRSWRDGLEYLLTKAVTDYTSASGQANIRQLLSERRS
ncbi:MAG: hypothetical protein SF123_11375 [Chloroflexota bacterium]|nr:hypothetical protein [Chloroflexota bacterium]